MKKTIIFSAIITMLAGFGCNCEDNAEEVKLDTVSSKASYAVGLQIGQSLETFPVEFDKAAFSAAVEDSISGADPRLSEEEIMAAFASLRTAAEQQMASQGDDAKNRGDAFLAENAKKDGVKVTESGLQYIVLKEGEGEKPAAADTVEVNYRGTTIDGKEFDSSYKRGQPASFGVGQVIPGWTEGLQLMTVGSKYQLFVPSELAYGPRGAGRDIGPNETLIFEVELLSIKK